MNGNGRCERCEHGGPVPPRSRRLYGYLARLEARRSHALAVSRDVVRLTRSRAWRRLQDRITAAECVVSPLPFGLVSSSRLAETHAERPRCAVHGRYDFLGGLL